MADIGLILAARYIMLYVKMANEIFFLGDANNIWESTRILSVAIDRWAPDWRNVAIFGLARRIGAADRAMLGIVLLYDQWPIAYITSLLLWHRALARRACRRVGNQRARIRFCVTMRRIHSCDVGSNIGGRHRVRLLFASAGIGQCVPSSSCRLLDNAAYRAALASYRKPRMKVIFFSVVAVMPPNVRPFLKVRLRLLHAMG